MVDGVVRRETWMPPAAVMNFVMDALEQFQSIGAFPVEIDPLKMSHDDHTKYWIPLIVVGTLEWVCVSGWWPWLYTGVFDTDEAYKWIFLYEGNYELSPDHLVVYRDVPEKNAYHERINIPGIEDRERSEILQFIYRDVFGRFKKEAPEDVITEPVIWATLMWVLSEYGRDWLAQDPIFHSVYTKGVGYLTTWDQKVLDPDKVQCTQRKVGSCASCGDSLWCTIGSLVNGEWHYLCDYCLSQMAEQGHKVDRWDKRVRQPRCGKKESCRYVGCRHNETTREGIEEEMVDIGRRRVDEYRNAYLSGESPRGLFNADEIVEYFK